MNTIDKKEKILELLVDKGFTKVQDFFYFESLDFKILKKLINTYKLDIPLFTETIKSYKLPFYVKETESNFYILYVVEDICDINKVIIVSILDTCFQIDYSELLTECSFLKENENNTPIGFISFEDFDYEKWFNTLSIKNTYIRGSKYKDLNIETFIFNSKEEFFINFENYKEFIEINKTYKDDKIEDAILYSQIYCKTHKYVVIKIQDKVLNKLAGIIVGAYNSSTNFLDGLWICVSLDAEVRKKHSMYNLLHIEMVKWGYINSMSQVSFNLYLPFKKVLNLECKYYSGIELK